MRSPLSLLFPRFQFQLTQPCLRGQMLLSQFCASSLDSLQYVHVSLALGSPELGPVLHVCPHQCWGEGKDHLPRSAGDTPPNAVQDSRLCCKSTLLVHVQLSVHPQVLFYQAAFQLGDPQHILCMGLVFPRCRTFHFSRLNFSRVLSAHFSSLLRSCWTAAGPSGLTASPPIFVSSANLLQGCSAPPPRSLMKILNRTGPSVIPGVHH